MLVPFFSFRTFSFLSKKPRIPSHRSTTSDDISYFRGLLGENNVLTSDIQSYNIDWMNKYKGDSPVVLKPRSTTQVSEILRYCTAQSIPVVPQSGNTGLVGGSVPHHDEIILSTVNLNKIIHFNQSTDVLSAEAGVILEQANKYLSSFNMEAPYDLGAKGSCCIGGNIATHAGGKYLVKHGALRGYVLGLEVVLASGEILDLTNSYRRRRLIDSPIDLKQLFIGSEGCLGVITRADIQCVPIAKEKTLMLLKTSSFASVLEIYKTARAILCKHIAAVEWMDSYSFDAVMKNTTSTNPFTSQNDLGKDYYLLIEANADQAESSLNSIIEEFYYQINSEGQANTSPIDCVISQTDKQFDELWKIRETVGGACGKLGKVFKYDVSLPAEEMDNITKTLRDKCSALSAYTVGYGHLGDGNLHINISAIDPAKEECLESTIEPFIFEWIANVRGSISAEHGLGLMKAEFLHLQKQQKVIQTMRDIKRIFDPNCILNPYKMLPEK